MPLVTLNDEDQRLTLHNPTDLPQAAGFLWNKQMMILMNCRGYAAAQFMQPEPAKYAYAPILEAKTFIQPEQPFFAHHPGRFFYIKDEESGELFSAPYEPTRHPLDLFEFTQTPSEICWHIECLGLTVDISLSLCQDDVVELWNFSLKNSSQRKRSVSIYPYFPFGYMSWMNQGACYEPELGGVVARCITPYQKVAQYFQNKNLKDLSYFLHSEKPDAWEANQKIFEGEGGLHQPSSINQTLLEKGSANYETPTAVLQYRRELKPNDTFESAFIFGPAKDAEEILSLRSKYLNKNNAAHARKQYRAYVDQGFGQLKIQTPDEQLNALVNTWLPRQVFYHGDVNRLTTDPQTRNFLQDNMGMSYIKPEAARSAFILALSQQHDDGAMPDGILLLKEAELKYINQIPHTDHCVWLPICLKAYLDETNDYALLDELVPFSDSDRVASVFSHIDHAMHWLIGNCDERGLAYIAQGDWCDPMNMVGYKGKGVSGWLTCAIAYALTVWADICKNYGDTECAEDLLSRAQQLNEDMNTHFWDGRWYARGITDDKVRFGVNGDTEGRIFLNPQSFAMLAGATTQKQREEIFDAVEKQLETPYGVMMLAPAYTTMREDVGRVTQKYPGSAENGSVYNHAAAFYIYSLYDQNEGDRAYRILRQMIPGPEPEDYKQRGQLPVFIPNYYRGAYYQMPHIAGRSSQLFNTGTVHWFYRCLIDGLLGLQGDARGLNFRPQLPQDWPGVHVERRFRGATFLIEMRRESIDTPTLDIDGVRQATMHFSNIEKEKTYRALVTLPTG